MRGFSGGRRLAWMDWNKGKDRKHSAWTKTWKAVPHTGASAVPKRVEVTFRILTSGWRNILKSCITLPFGPQFSALWRFNIYCIFGGKFTLNIRWLLIIIKNNLGDIISVNCRVRIWAQFLTPVVFSCLYIRIFLVFNFKIRYGITDPILCVCFMLLT